MWYRFFGGIDIAFSRFENANNYGANQTKQHFFFGTVRENPLGCVWVGEEENARGRERGARFISLFLWASLENKEKQAKKISLEIVCRQKRKLDFAFR